MGIFNNELMIDKDNPFKEDKLDREEEIKNLTAIFKIVKYQMVLAVNSQWGTGKTSFLQMWNQYLKNEGYKTIFFNAWENDYVEEPFIAFVDEIRDSINDEDKIRGFMEKAKDIGLALVKQSPKIVSKVIKNKTGIDSDNIISDDELTKIISEKIDDYSKNKKSVDKFRRELEKIALKEFEQNTKPMIIFVDELDRCRPDYAISLLERIKHFFNVQNIIFILGIDKEALSNSIKVIYGEQTNTNSYLTKFIDLEYKIKESKVEEYAIYLLEKYEFNKIYEKREFSYEVDEDEEIYEEFKKIFIDIVIGFKLSLRDIEKFIFEIFMILKVNNDYVVSPKLLLIVCAIKRINKSLYEQLKLGGIKYKTLISDMGQHKENIKNWLESEDGIVYKSCLIWLLSDTEELNIEKGDSIVNDQYNSIEETIVSYGTLDGGVSEYKTNLYYMAELYESFTLADSQ